MCVYTVYCAGGWNACLLGLYKHTIVAIFSTCCIFIENVCAPNMYVCLTHRQFYTRLVLLYYEHEDFHSVNEQKHPTAFAIKRNERKIFNANCVHIARMRFTFSKNVHQPNKRLYVLSVI